MNFVSERGVLIDYFKTLTCQIATDDSLKNINCIKFIIKSTCFCYLFKIICFIGGKFILLYTLDGKREMGINDFTILEEG